MLYYFRRKECISNSIILRALHAHNTMWRLLYVIHHEYISCANVARVEPLLFNAANILAVSHAYTTTPVLPVDNTRTHTPMDIFGNTQFTQVRIFLFVFVLCATAGDWYWFCVMLTGDRSIMTAAHVHKSPYVTYIVRWDVFACVQSERPNVV